MAQDDVEQLSATLAPFFRETVPRSERVDALLRLLIAALLRHDALRRLLAVQQLGTADVEDAYQARRAHAQRDASHTHHLRTYARASRRTKRCCSMQEM